MTSDVSPCSFSFSLSRCATVLAMCKSVDASVGTYVEELVENLERVVQPLVFHPCRPFVNPYVWYEMPILEAALERYRDLAYFFPKKLARRDKFKNGFLLHQALRLNSPARGIHVEDFGTLITFQYMERACVGVRAKKHTAKRERERVNVCESASEQRHS